MSRAHEPLPARCHEAAAAKPKPQHSRSLLRCPDGPARWCAPGQHGMGRCAVADRAHSMCLCCLGGRRARRAAVQRGRCCCSCCHCRSCRRGRSRWRSWVCCRARYAQATLGPVQRGMRLTPSVFGCPSAAAAPDLRRAPGVLAGHAATSYTVRPLNDYINTCYVLAQEGAYADCVCKLGSLTRSACIFTRVDLLAFRPFAHSPFGTSLSTPRSVGSTLCHGTALTSQDSPMGGGGHHCHDSCGHLHLDDLHAS